MLAPVKFDRLAGAKPRDAWHAGAALLIGVGIAAAIQNPGFAMAALAAAGAAVALLAYPEVALALYTVVGDIKGDDRLAALLPFDLTLLLAAVLLAGIALNFLRGRTILPLPRVYFLFLILLAAMVASLSYTPVFDAGVEKLLRFVSVTGIVIVAPFAALTTAGAFKRFMAAFGVAAFAICGWALLALGGAERLVTPSNNTIGLGHVACALLFLMWFAVIPRYGFPWRIFTYALLVVPALALIGSGSRGPAIACACVVVISALRRPALFFDLGLLALLGLLVLPFSGIPRASLEYLGTLTNASDPASLAAFRGDLWRYGGQTIAQHPLMGVGLQGFRYTSPNPGVYNWPHNIFLELACELGIPVAALVLILFASAVREAIRQLALRRSPCSLLSELSAALLLGGLINAINTGDINSDRSTWLFLSLVFVTKALIGRTREKLPGADHAAHLALAEPA